MVTVENSINHKDKSRFNLVRVVILLNKYFFKLSGSMDSKPV